MLNYDLLYYMPSLLGAWDDIRQYIVEGHSVVVQIQSRRQKSMVVDLFRGMMNAGFGERMDFLNVAEDPEKSPIRVLEDLLDVDWKDTHSPRTVENLLASDGLPDGILILGLEDLSRECFLDWSAILYAWTRIALDKRVPGLLIVTSKDLRAERTVARSGPWHYVEWQNCPTRLEIQLMVDLSGEMYSDSRGERIWRRHLLSSLAGTDLELVDFLWDAVLEDRKAIVKTLQRYVDERQWISETLQAWDVPMATGDGSELSTREAAQAEADGLLLTTDRRQRTLHPAVAVAMGHYDLVDQMIWNGQLQAAYPLLNQVRYRLVCEITRRIGEGWPSLVKRDDDPELPAFSRSAAADFRQIRDILECRPELVALRDRYHSVACQGLKLRNRLAHYDLVSFGDFQSWLSEAEETGLC